MSKNQGFRVKGKLWNNLACAREKKIAKKKDPGNFPISQMIFGERKWKKISCLKYPEISTIFPEK